MRKGFVILMSISTLGFAQLGLNWEEVGPNNIGGRTRTVLYDKTDATGKTIFAGSVGGGVFKSLDGGLSWSPVNDQSGVFNVSCMSQAADGTIYAGTGETFFYRNMSEYKSQAFKGTGLYKFSPTGNTFTLVQDSSLFGDINEIATHPTNAQIIYVASTKGFFISTDGGANFTLDNTAPAQDVKIGIDGHVYCVIGDYTTTNNKVFKSTTGTPGSFTDITPTSTVNPNVNKMGRIEIAISPSDPNYVYLLVSKTGTTSTTNIYAPKDQDLNAVYGSNDKGSTWTIITLGSYGQFDIFQQFYGTDEGGNSKYNYYGAFANTIKVHPTDPKNIFIGGYTLYQWKQNPSASFGNGTWSQVGTEVFADALAQFYLHPFIHDISFKINNPNEFMVATNGGLYKGLYNNNTFNFLSANRGHNTTQLNTLGISNFPTNIGTGSQAVPSGGVVGASFSEGPLYIKGSATPSLALNAQTYSQQDAYGMEFSRINNKTAFVSFNYGNIQRNTNIKTNPFAGFTDVLYTSAVASSGTKPSFPSFSGLNTPLSLFENWGQLTTPPDSFIFWNKVDTLSIKLSASNNNQKTFVFNYTRPQKNAYYDVVIVRTGPTKTQATSSPSQIYTVSPVYTGTNITSYTFAGTGFDNSNSANHSISLKANLLDSIKITLSSPPLSTNDSIVMICVGLRYNAGDWLYAENTDLGISGYTHIDSIQLSSDLSYTATPSIINTVKIPMTRSARLAVGIKKGVMVTKRPLNGDISPPWVKIAGSNSRIDDVGGVPSSTFVAVKGDVTNLQWAPAGTELYFSTYDATTNSYYLYRISHIGFIGDNDFRDYGPLFTSDIDSAFTKISGSSVVADRTKKKYINPIRTTAIGKFNYPITSISVSDNNQTVLITLGGYNTTGGRVFVTNSDARLLPRNETDASNFVDKTGNLPNIPVYASLFLQQNNNTVLIGTENGVYSTSDITVSSPTWAQDNNGQLPLVPVYQLKQQTLPPWLCYNSGYIYAATHGRGIWATSKYATPYIVSVNEIEQRISNNDALFIYPNPASDYTKVQFNLPAGSHNINMMIMDITGKIISSQATRINSTGNTIELEINTTNLNSGIYIIQLKSSDFVKSGKMIIVR